MILSLGLLLRDQNGDIVHFSSDSRRAEVVSAYYHRMPLSGKVNCSFSTSWRANALTMKLFSARNVSKIIEKVSLAFVLHCAVLCPRVKMET